MSKQHYHALFVEEDLVLDYNWNSSGFGNQGINEFPNAIGNLFRVESDGFQGYELPIGFIHRMENLEYSKLYTLSNINTAIPADMYKHIQTVANVLDMSGFKVSFSDILRFMIWVNFPSSIAPDGDLMTGEYGWLPPVVWMFEIFDNYVRFDLKESKYIQYQIGRKCCDRVYSNILVPGISEQQIVNAFTNGCWKPEVVRRSLTLWNGEEFNYIAIRVLREVNDNDMIDDVAQSN